MTFIDGLFLNMPTSKMNKASYLLVRQPIKMLKNNYLLIKEIILNEDKGAKGKIIKQTH